MRKSALTKVCPSCQDDGLVCPACDTGRHCEAIAPVCDTCQDDGLACNVCEGDNEAAWLAAEAQWDNDAEAFSEGA